MRATCLVLATASLALYAPRTARACSQPPCWPGAFVPGDHARVPANMPALYWRPMSGPAASADPTKVVLSSTAAPKTPIAFTTVPVADGDFLLIPTAPLSAGGSYTLSDRNVCDLTGESGPEVTFSVELAAPLPSELGALSAASPSMMQMDLETRIGSCSSKATVAQTSIELAPAAAAAIWLDALHFETLVDGHPWHYQTALNVRVPPGESQSGRARDRVFAVCASDDKTVTGLAPGPHVVAMRATLPGTKDVVVSSSLDVVLRCDAAPEPMPVEPPDDTHEREGNGGCSAGGARAPGLAFALLALFALFGARAPRRPVARPG